MKTCTRIFSFAVCKRAFLLATCYRINITKTCLYNFYSLKPHFYILVVKLGFTGVYIIFLISAQNIGCGYSLEPPRRGCSNEYPQSMFLSRNMTKYQNFLSENFQVWWWNVQYTYLNKRVFVMICHTLLEKYSSFPKLYDEKTMVFTCEKYQDIFIISSQHKIVLGIH